MIVVDAQNIDLESYYNLCRISDLTYTPNPIAATKDLGYIWEVEKDIYGNITTASKVRDNR